MCEDEFAAVFLDYLADMTRRAVLDYLADMTRRATRDTSSNACIRALFQNNPTHTSNGIV